MSSTIAVLVGAHLLGGVSKPVCVLPIYAGVGLVALLATFILPPLELNSPTTGSALLLAAYFSARSAFSPVSYLARESQLLIGACLAAYLIAGTLTRGGPNGIWLTRTLLVLACGHGIIALIQASADPEFMPFLIVGARRAGARASGFFLNPNHLAFFLNLAGLIGAALFAYARSGRIERYLLITIMTGCAAAHALAASRGGLAAACAGVLVLVTLGLRFGSTFRWTQLRWLAAPAAGLVAGLLLLYVLQPHTVQRLVELRDYRLRTPLWGAALQQFALSPILGTGAGSYLVYSRRFVSPEIQGDPVHAHCEYLEILAEFGLVGAVLALGFIVLHARAASRNLAFDALAPPDHRQSFGVRLGAIAALVAAAAHALLDFSIRMPANALVVAILLGLVVARRNPHSREVFVPVLDLRRLPLLVMGLLLCVAAARWWPAEWRVYRAAGLIAAGEYSAAGKEAAGAITLDRTNPEAFRLQGRAFSMDAAADTTNDPSALLERGALAYSQGLELFPTDAAMLLAYSWTLDSLGRCAEAESVLARATEWAPTWWQTHAYLGYHRECCGDLNGAVTAYETSIDLHGNQIASDGLKRLQSR